MEIYVLTIENCEDFEHSTDVEVFTDLDEANNRVVELKNEFEKENDLDGYECFYCTDGDEALKSYCAYADGNYNNDHYVITLWQREV